MIWQNVRDKNHTDHTGATFISHGDGNIQTRVGLKAWLDSYNTVLNFNFKPYLELNWIHNSKTFRTRVNNYSDAIQGTKDIAEFKSGIETHIGNNIQLWGAFAYQNGKHKYADNQFNFGMKYVF